MLERKDQRSEEREFIIQSWRQDPTQGRLTNSLEHHDVSAVTMWHVMANGCAHGGLDAKSRNTVVRMSQAERGRGEDWGLDRGAHEGCLSLSQWPSTASCIRITQDG